MSIETDNNLLIRADEAWRLTRDSPERARVAANAVIEACGPGDVAARVAALRARGWAERVVFSHTDARSSLRQAARLARAHGLDDRLVDVLVTRAGVHLEIGDFGAALRDIRAAREVLAGATTAELDGQEAVIEAKRGEFIRAVALSRRARAMLGADHSPVTKVTTLNNLAMSLIQLGQTDEAEDVLVEAQVIAAELGTLVLGTITQTLALAAVRAGHLAQALVRFDQAESILADAGWPLGEVYLERVESLVTLHLLAEADTAARRAIRRLDGPGGAMLLAEALLQHAQVLRWEGSDDEALVSAQRAVTLFRRQRRSGFRARAELVVLQLRLQAGTASAVDIAQARRGARALERVGWQLEAVDAHLLLGRLATELGRPALALSAFRAARARARSGPALMRAKGMLAQALGATEPREVLSAARRGLGELARFRTTLPTSELRALASGHGVELAELGLSAAMAGGRVGAIFEWMERGRLASALTSPPVLDDIEVEEGLANLRDVVSRQRGVIDDPDEQIRLRSEQTRIESRIQRRMRQVHPDVITADQVVTVGQLTESVGQERALVIYAAVGDQLVAISVANQRRVHTLGSLSAARAEVTGVLFELRRATRARTPEAVEAVRGGITRSLEALNEYLVGPIHQSLGDREHVVVVPPARLFSVPWHALPSLSGRSVSVSPSATMWHRASSASPRGSGMTVVAGPGLSGAIDEATAVASLYPQARLLLPPDSTADAVASAMAEASMAHLACHGIFRADNPSFSSLELSDGPLTVIDLERMGRTPDLVVLAACDTGASEVLPGEELRGFLAAVLTLGTHAVVASAVPVPDVDTASMMTRLHAELRGGARLAEAVRRARNTCDTATANGLVASLAFGCFGVGHLRLGVDDRP